MRETAKQATAADAGALLALAYELDPATGTLSCKEAANRIRALVSAPSADNRPFGALTDLYNIDSAGGAKGECCVPDAGEPSFVFLGRDPQAPALVEQWADERERAEPDSAKPAAARDIARRMREFKNANPDKGMPASAVIAQPAEGDGAVGYLNISEASEGDGWQDSVTMTAAGRALPVGRHAIYTRPAATAVVPEDFLSHKDAWRNALNRCVRHAKDSDDATYWMHEVRAFDKAHEQLAAAPAAPKGGVVDEAMISAGADALVLGWNLHYPDATRMSKEVLTAALATAIARAEALERDAERWRFCVKHGVFPVRDQSGDRWVMFVAVTSSRRSSFFGGTTEEAIDAAIAAQQAEGE